MARGLLIYTLAVLAITSLVLSIQEGRQEKQRRVELSSLRDATLPQFTQEQGEMKADDNIFSSEGQSAPKVESDWTGHGGAAFSYLQHEASSPVEEAEDSLSQTLRDATPHTSRYNLYGRDDSGSRHEHNRFSHNLRRMRQLESAKRHAQDRSFFQGVQKAFGKKEGSFLEKEFDPSLTAANKQKKHTESEPRHFQHPGVIASASKIKAMVQSLKHAHGSKKSEIKARMLSLQKEIANDYSKVTAFGQRAESRLKREEAKKAKASHSQTS